MMETSPLCSGLQPHSHGRTISLPPTDVNVDPDYHVLEQLFLLCQYWIPGWPTGQLCEEVVPRSSRLFAPSFTWSVNARAIAVPPGNWLLRLQASLGC